MSSALKVKLPVFKRGQLVKVSFPDQLPRMGMVTSTKDYDTRPGVRVKFDREQSITVSKDYICLPRNGASAPEPVTSEPEQNSPAEEEHEQPEQNSPAEDSGIQEMI